MKFCHVCGQQVLMTAVICPHCGTGQATQTLAPTQQPVMTLSELLFSFQGRISLGTYWFKFTFPLYALYALSWLLDSSGVLFMLVVLLGIYPSLAVAVKRCHDRDRSGLFLLVFLIPIVSIWPAIELAFIPGTYGSNQYGRDPRM